MVGRFYQNLQKGWVPPLRWRRRPHPRAGLARTTSLLNERMPTSICGVGLSQRDHGIAATDHGEHHFLPAGAHNPLEPRNSNVAPNSASGHYCDGRGAHWLGVLTCICTTSALLTASARAVLRLQVPEHVERAFERPGSRWTVRFESSTPAGEPHIPMISTASQARRARV